MARSAARLAARPNPRPPAQPQRAAPDRPRAAMGNQARLRAKPTCEECERHQTAPEAAPDAVAAAPEAAGATPARPTGPVDVWGLPIGRSACRCRSRIRDEIAWTRVAAATYAACDIPANADADAVEKCFATAHPTAVVVATTSSSGAITLPPPSTDPCDRISDKATRVHEVMHARHADSMARAQGPAFFAAWQRLTGDPDRLDKLRSAFPREVAAFTAQWNDGHDWAQDEVHSYTWQRRFLESALLALDRIC